MKLKVYFIFVFFVGVVSQEYGAPIDAKFQGSQDPMKVPRGIFHYSMREAGIGSNFKVPDSEDFSALQLGGNYRTKDSMVDGFYLPMPMGMDPINFQLIRAKERFNELQTTQAEETVGEAYAHMQSECKYEATVACESAMRRYYELKTIQNNEVNAPIHEKLMKLGDVLSRAAVRNDESNDLGVLFSAPGIQPIGWHANMARLNKNNIKID